MPIGSVEQAARRRHTNSPVIACCVALGLLAGGERRCGADERGYRLALDGDFAVRHIALRDFLRQDGLFTIGDSSADTVTGGVRLRLFLPRVVDDEASPQLQPFLQRASSVWLEAGGGWGRDEDWLAPANTHRGGGVGAGGDVYLTPRIAAWLRLRYQHIVYQVDVFGVSASSDMEHLEAGGGLALRLRDVRVGLGYSYRGTWFRNGSAATFGDSYTSSGWGEVALDLQAVVERRLVVLLGARLWDGSMGSSGGPGGGASAALLYFLRRGTGLRVGIGGTGGFAPRAIGSFTLVDRLYAVGSPSIAWGLGVTHFFGGRFGLSVGYEGRYGWYEANIAYPTLGTTLSSALQLGLHARF